MKYKNRIRKLIKDSNHRKKIKIYMATKTASDDFDNYESRYTYSNLNPLTIVGYYTPISPETSYWKHRGLTTTEVGEILIEEKYENYFRNCNKIEIDGNTYQVMKEGTGSRSAIMKRPYKMIRVTVTREE